MGRHSANPDKQHIPRKVTNTTHSFLIFCKHTILEIPAGVTAILIFESHREKWLEMVGTPETTHNVAMFLFGTFT